MRLLWLAGWLAGEAIGLDATHVRWWNIDGPDVVDNAMALCVLHHRLLDRGVVGLAPDGTVLVSQLFVGRESVARALVFGLVGHPVLAPQLPHVGVSDEQPDLAH